MQIMKLMWLGGLVGLAQGYAFGTGTGTGTDPSSTVVSTSAPYGNYTYYPTGTAVTDPPYTPTGTAVSTGDPSGTAASTGLDPSGKPTYTAPTGYPTEYYYHHKKPKRNAPWFGRYGRYA